MKRSKITIQIILAVIFLCIITVQRTYAYLNPGTGSMVIQILVASFIGAIYMIKIFWKRVKSFIQRLLGKGLAGNDSAER